VGGYEEEEVAVGNGELGLMGWFGWWYINEVIWDWILNTEYIREATNEFWIFSVA